jgi:hypothetical protein
VDLDVLVGGLVAVDDDLVAGLPAGDALADLPDDARGVRAADVVVLGVERKTDTGWPSAAQTLLKFTPAPSRAP